MITLTCSKKGRIGTQVHLCRYEHGHVGLCTFQLAGAVPLLVPPPPWLAPAELDTSVPPGYDGDIPGYVDDALEEC